VSRRSSAQRPDVGGQIRKARDAAGISQVELAIRLKCGERTVQAWERNERTPRLDALASLAAELGQPVAFFYGSSDPDTNDAPAEAVA
jgi:transcriptional regulator with XRE-family HTH domain